MPRSSSAAQDQLLELAAPTLARCIEIWGEPALSDALALSISPRLHRSLGRCYPERGLVRIAPVVLMLPRALQEEIICHEAAHLLAFSRHGKSERPHGAEWKQLMQAVGFAPRARILVAPGDPISTAWAGRAQRRYEHRCPVCHVVRFARRRMTQWRCRECVTYGLEGRLVISSSMGRELSL